jgi:hypothetical protein
MRKAYLNRFYQPISNVATGAIATWKVVATGAIAIWNVAITVDSDLGNSDF